MVGSDGNCEMLYGIWFSKSMHQSFSFTSTDIASCRLAVTGFRIS